MWYRWRKAISVCTRGVAGRAGPCPRRLLLAILLAILLASGPTAAAWAQSLWSAKELMLTKWPPLILLGALGCFVVASWLHRCLLLPSPSSRSRPVARNRAPGDPPRAPPAISTGLGDLVLVLDQERTVRLHSQTASFPSPASSTEPVSRGLDELGLPETTVAELERAVSSILEDGTHGWRDGCADLTSNGRLLRAQLTPMRGLPGQTEAVAVVVRDVTQEMDAQEAQQGRSAFDRALTATAIAIHNLAATEQDAEMLRLLGRTGVFLGASRGYVTLIDGDNGRLARTLDWTAPGVAPLGSESRSMPQALFPGWMQTLREGRGICVRRVGDLPPSWALEWAILEARNVRSLIAAPLWDANRLLGFVGFEALGVERAWSEDDLRDVQTLADLWAAVHIRRARDAERALRDADYREAIDDIQEIVFRTDAAGRWIFLNAAWERVTGYTMRRSIGRRCLDFVHPADRALGLLPFRGLIRGDNGACRRQLRCVTQDGAVRWLEVYVRLRRDAHGEISGSVGTLTDITERRTAEEEIRQLAFFDALTGLPNRRLLVDRLRQALASSDRHRKHGALLFIDLDNFKGLNDTRGHETGDRLLEEAARRLRGAVRQSDTVARFGGDEFVVMLTDLSTSPRQAATEVAIAGEKIRDALAAPYNLAGGAFQCTSSIGATLFFDHQRPVDALLRQADTAMYKAKAAGRNTLRFHDPAAQVRHSAHAQQALDLPEALRRGELHLVYQPQLDDRGRILGAEALLRWRHPRRGTITAAELIPRAVGSGMILTLSRWALEHACVRLASWAADPDLAHLTLAVNVSQQQLKEPHFLTELVTILETTGADPRSLRLELPGQLYSDDLDLLAAKLHAIKAHGVGLALDDFGRSPGSLLELARLPLDQLKIDPSFTHGMLRDPKIAAVTRTILAIGQTLGLAVVAEGVERAEQRGRLLEVGCRGFQGYLFSRPVPRRILKAKVRDGCVIAGPGIAGNGDHQTIARRLPPGTGRPTVGSGAAGHGNDSPTDERSSND